MRKHTTVAIAVAAVFLAAIFVGLGLGVRGSVQAPKPHPYKVIVDVTDYTGVCSGAPQLVVADNKGADLVSADLVQQDQGVYVATVSIPYGSPVYEVTVCGLLRPYAANASDLKSGALDLATTDGN